MGGTEVTRRACAPTVLPPELANAFLRVWLAVFAPMTFVVCTIAWLPTLLGLAAWALVSFGLAPPRPWPAFQRWIAAYTCAAAQEHLQLRVDRQEYDAGLRKLEREAQPRAGCVAGLARPPLLFAQHPHGLNAAACNITTMLTRFWRDKAGMPDVTMHVGTGFWFMPGTREFFSFMGYRSIGPASVRRSLADRIDCGIVPGGFEEAVLSQPGAQELWLKRAGWIKFVLQAGPYGVVPVYTFGETDMVPQVSAFRLARARLAGRFRVPAAIPKTLRLLPAASATGTPLCSVVGEPLWFPHIAEPSPAQVREWHGRYVDALQGLYDRHKGKHGCANVQLRMHLPSPVQSAAAAAAAAASASKVPQRDGTGHAGQGREQEEAAARTTETRSER